MTVTQYIREHLLEQAGLIQPDVVDYNILVTTEWSSIFEKLMRNRLIVGSYRYGRLGAKGKPTYANIPSMIKRLQAYETDGNDEHLVDVANLCLCEFIEGTHPLKHFGSIDEHDLHVVVKGKSHE